MLQNEDASRLNPFSLQSETNARYLMVIAAFLVFLWIMGNYIARDLDSEFFTNASQMVLPSERKIREMSLTLETGKFFTQEQYFNLTRIQILCSQQFLIYLRVFVEGLIFPSLFILLAILYYLLHPLILKQKNRSIELAPAQDIELINLVHVLSQSVGIARTPRIVIGGLLTDAQVYGVGNNYVIRLGHFTRLLYKKDNTSFRAIVLHELAHIANNDVLPTYIVQGVWVSAIAASFTFLAYFIVQYGDFYFSSGLDVITRIALQVLAYLLILRIIIFHLLKSREHYADWMVASWGHKDKIEGLLDKSVTAEISIISFLRFHSPVVERINVLRRPYKLFNLNYDLGFLSGVLVGMLLSHSQVIWNDVFGLLNGYSVEYFHAYLLQNLVVRVGNEISASHILLSSIISSVLSVILGIMDTSGIVVTALLVTGIVGVQTQRLVLLDLVLRLSFIRILFARLGFVLCMAIGLEFGFLLNLFPIYIYPSLSGEVELAHVYLLSITIFSAVMFVWLAIVNILTHTILASEIGNRITVFRQLVIGAISSLLLWILLEPFNFWRLISMGPYINIFNSNEVLTDKYLSDIRFLSYEVIFTLVSLIIFFGTMTLVCIFLKLRRFIMPVSCPNCSKPNRVRSISVVEKDCKYCESKLSRWLYVVDKL